MLGLLIVLMSVMLAVLFNDYLKFLGFGVYDNDVDAEPIFDWSWVGIFIKEFPEVIKVYLSLAFIKVVFKKGEHYHKIKKH